MKALSEIVHTLEATNKALEKTLATMQETIRIQRETTEALRETTAAIRLVNDGLRRFNARMRQMLASAPRLTVVLTPEDDARMRVAIEKMDEVGALISN